MKIEVKTLSSMRIIALRHIGPYPQIGGTFDRLFGLAGPLGVPMRGVLATFLDDPDTTSPEELRSDACLIVPDDYELPATAPTELRLDSIAGGDYAVTTHMGAYDGLRDAWIRFDGQIVSETGREPGDGACFEWYVNDCNEVPVEEVRTDLYVLLKPATSSI
ncbi:MAG TPA: GyrI-like domain-containing protein [Fimbriimonadaceae bacterium]|nr:GyrI-like domain-containing protein [Fimbriimonadaceae bacterium]